MADSTTNSQGSSQNSSQSTSTPIVVQTPQSQWGLQLSQLLGALAQNQYNWAMNQYNNGMGVTDQNIAQYTQLANRGAGMAQDLIGRYQNVFEPLMNQYIQQAGTYNSEARQRFMMGQAESTAGQADQAAIDAATRQLQGFGINPNSGRYQDLLLTSRLQDAATRAGAGTQASLNTAATGRQMLQQAAQMGQNIPGMAVNALQSAYTGITGAENAILGQQNTGANLLNTVPNFGNAAANANRLPPVGQNTQSSGQGSSQQQSKSQQNKPDSSSGSGAGKGSQTPPWDPLANANATANKGLSAGQQLGGFIPQKENQDQQDNSFGDRAPLIYDPFNGTANSPGFNGPGGYSNLSGFVDTSGKAMASRSPWGPIDPFNGSGSQPGYFNTPGALSPDGSSNGPVNPFGGNNTPSDPFGSGNGPTDPFGNANPTVNRGSWQGGNYSQDLASQAGINDIGSNLGNYGGGNDLASQAGINDIGSNLGQFDQSGGSQFDPNAFGDPNATFDPGMTDQPSTDFSGGGGGGDYGGTYSGGYARGGAIGNQTTGGGVPASASPSQGRQTDDIPARLNAGEYVIPRDVTQHLGTKHFADLIAKSRKARTGMAGPKPGGKMKPALRMRPTFTSHYTGQ